MDRNSPNYYVERTEDSVPHTKQLIAYIRELSSSKGVTNGTTPKPSQASPHELPQMAPPMFTLYSPPDLLSRRQINYLENLAI